MANTLLIIVTLCLTWVFLACEAQKPPLVNGLSWTFYKSSCPKLESIVRKELKKVFKNDIGQAAGLLRLHFHDCFVQGCDGSVLLEGSAGGPSEQDAPPNLTLRAKAFQIINNLRALIHKQCGRVVSCADITTLAARDSVFLVQYLVSYLPEEVAAQTSLEGTIPHRIQSGGPDYDVPLGRRDGLKFATLGETLANLPAPSSNASVILSTLARNQNLTATDVVALSGGHTIGLSHCTSFTNRLYPTQDPIMEKTFAKNLKVTCPAIDTNNTTNLDIRTPNTFDNKYYVDLMNRQGLFTSDQDLYTDSRTRGIVKDFAVNQDLFFRKFVISMIKMSQLKVLTGSNGEIRANCSVRNSNNVGYLASVVPGEEEVGSVFK